MQFYSNSIEIHWLLRTVLACIDSRFSFTEKILALSGTHALRGKTAQVLFSESVYHVISLAKESSMLS